MPKLSARKFDYETLKTMLKADDRIVIVSCDSCARRSDGLGGQAGLDALGDKLVADGFKVVGRALLHIACVPEHWGELLKDEAMREVFERADVIIPLACSAGEDRSGQSLPAVRMLRVTRTLGDGSYSEEEGARLVEPVEGVELKVTDPEGIPLGEAARKLGLHPGSF